MGPVTTGGTPVVAGGVEVVAEVTDDVVPVEVVELAHWLLEQTCPEAQQVNHRLSVLQETY
jgi:hypothetical protein